MVARCVSTGVAAGVLGVLAATPALAAGDPFFTLNFTSNPSSSTNGGITGIQAEATYTFSSTNVGDVTLSLKNLSGSPVTSSRLVGTGLNLPTNPPADADIGITSFSQSDTNWNVSYGDSLPPFGVFDVCASSTPSGACDAPGSPNNGLLNGQSTTIGTFTLNSTPSLATATAYRNAFVAMFQAPPSGGSAANFDGNYFVRFKAIQPGGGSDKVWATSITVSPDPNPGDAVPGPLPLFGAAAAFGYSRKLRRRMKIQSA